VSAVLLSVSQDFSPDFPLLLGAIILPILAACVAQPYKMTRAFDAAEYQAALAPGAGKITGQLFARTVGGEVKYGAGSTVYLYPMTA
jgi:hypothetical protein